MRDIYFFVLWGMHFMIFSSCLGQLLGLKEFTFEDKARSFDGEFRKIEVACWYPTEQQQPIELLDLSTWKTKPIIRNALLPNKKLPLILFSHGYSGNQWTNSWFAEYMAEQGYMVAIVRHYGNSYPNMIPEICARPWHRPQDMSFVLDRLLEIKELQNNIDANCIMAAGFSQGGIACMWLGGVQAHLTFQNLKQQITVVNNPECKKLHFKDIPLSRLESILDMFTEQDLDDANKSYYDERFKALFVMAPGIDEKNIMFIQEGLSQAKIPMHICVGEEDQECVEQSLFFTQHIPLCHLHIIPGKVSHMTLLNEGTDKGRVTYPLYTVDHSSIDRSEIHKVVIKQARRFFADVFKSECLKNVSNISVEGVGEQ